MNIHEFQAKALFRAAGIPTPDGEVATSVEEALAIYDGWGGVVAVKAQVHTGGRGKAGGVKIAKSREDVEAAATAAKVYLRPGRWPMRAPHSGGGLYPATSSRTRIRTAIVSSAVALPESSLFE